MTVPCINYIFDGGLKKEFALNRQLKVHEFILVDLNSNHPTISLLEEKISILESDELDNFIHYR